MALAFQVLWIKQLGLIVGVDVYAVTTCVSAFFAGLALGGLVIGRRADSTSRPLRLYARLELGVAITGVATTLALAHSARLFVALDARSGVVAWTLVVFVVGVAPFLMGGTLPAIVRSLDLQSGRIGAGGGRMYAANTAGAVLGALASSFLLIPALGLRGTAFAAAAVGALAALGATWLDRAGPGVRPVAPAPQPAPVAKGATVAILFYAVAGGLALGYEVVWSQAVVQFMSTRTAAFSVMLAVYLSGLALGSVLFAARAERVRDPWAAFGVLVGAAGLVALLEVSLLGAWLPGLQDLAAQAALGATSNRLAEMCVRFGVAALAIVFVPTLLLGAAFPTAVRLIVGAGHVGRDLGRVAALNTAGGIVGTLVTGFVLVPRYGVVRTLAILAVLAALLGLTAAVRGPSGWRGTRLAAVAILLVAVVAAVLTPVDRLASLLADTRGGGTLVFYQEGVGVTVAVVEQAAGRKRFRRLFIQGVSNTGDTMPSRRYMRLQALLPLVVHGHEPRSALVIGLGTGITAGALLQDAGLERRVVAELLPGVVAAAGSFEGNFGATADPRLDIRVRDGRRELLGQDQAYDLITLEPPPPSAAGVVNLYSTDFYELARGRLRPGGVVAQWLPLPTQNDEDTRSLVRSFLDAYPHASLWTTELHEMLLVGSLAPLVLDVPRIVDRFTRPEVAAALRDVGVSSPEALLATWVTGRSGLESYAGDALPVTDDRPRIEHADWVRPDELHRVLPRLLELRTDPPLERADDTFVRTVRAERQTLLLFYQSALNGMAGHRDLWARDLQRVLETDGANPYYRWFTRDSR